MTVLNTSEIFTKKVALLIVILHLKVRRAKDCNPSRKAWKRSERSKDCASQVVKAIWVRLGKAVQVKKTTFSSPNSAPNQSQINGRANY